MYNSIDETFKEAVVRDVRQNPQPTDEKTLHERPREWLRYLNGLKRDVEIQFAAQKSRIASTKVEYDSANKTSQEWNEYKAKELAWKVGAVRFAASIEDKMLYVKSLITEEYEDADDNLIAA